MGALPYGRHDVDEADIAAVTDVLRSDWLTTGPAVGRFESALSKAVNADNAVAVANGTAALHATYSALGIGPGEIVIVPAITFVATANAARQTGADVLFADVDPQTGLMTTETLSDALMRAGSAAKAVCVVHLGGQPVDLEPIAAITQARGLLLIEDACHAIGSTYKQSYIGDCTYSDAACFSFHPVKTIAMGEGGAVTTKNSALADAIKRLRHHNMMPGAAERPWERSMEALGYNYRACDIQCALGTSQLNKLARFKQIRQALMEQYAVTLSALGAPAKLTSVKVETSACNHLAQVAIDFDALGTSRAAVMAALAEQGIGTQVHYQPVSSQPYYKHLYGAADLPGAQAFYDQTLSLPLHTGMSLAEVNHVCRSLTAVLTGRDVQACA